MLLNTYTEDPVATISTSVMLLYVAYIWIQGIIGIICTNSIKRTYGEVISKGWALMRMVRILCNAAMSGVILVNMGYRLIGYYVAIKFGNIIGCLLIVILNIFFYRSDQTRFYQSCNKKLAKKTIWAERRLGCSVITRISLIFTVFSLECVFKLKIDKGRKSSKIGA